MRYAYKEKSFYFLLFTVIYLYIGVSIVFFRVMANIDHGDSLILLGPMYFIASAVYVVVFLRGANKKFKPHDNL
jgi:hypothetical protein